jgi:hypothetical protein
MKEKTTPPAALAALRRITGALYRHGPEESREFLSLATRLETGIWAGVKDRGIFPGSVYGSFCGDSVVVDLYLHVVAEDGTVTELPVQWAMRTTFPPVVLLGVPGDVGETPHVAPTAEMSWPQYQSIHRPDIVGVSRFGTFVPRGETRFDQPVAGVVGSIYEDPLVQTYRCGSDDACDARAICVSASYDYPSDAIVGCPAVDDFGRLVGITIGTGPGPERGHVGMYVAADLVVTAIPMARAAIAALRRGDRHSTGIERVQFWNSDVMFDEEFARERQPTHYRDQMVKVVLPRRTWDAVIAQAEAGYGTDASQDSHAEVDALKTAVGE